MIAAVPRIGVASAKNTRSCVGGVSGWNTARAVEEAPSRWKSVVRVYRRFKGRKTRRPSGSKLAFRPGMGCRPRRTPLSPGARRS